MWLYCMHCTQLHSGCFLCPIVRLSFCFLRPIVQLSFVILRLDRRIQESLNVAVLYALRIAALGLIFAETRREYVPVGSTTASLRLMVSAKPTTHAAFSIVALLTFSSARSSVAFRVLRHSQAAPACSFIYQ